MLSLVEMQEGLTGWLPSAIFCYAGKPRLREGKGFTSWHSGQARTWTQVSLIQFLPHFPDTYTEKTNLQQLCLHFINLPFSITTHKWRIMVVTGIYHYLPISNCHQGLPFPTCLCKRLGDSLLWLVIFPLSKGVAPLLSWLSLTQADTLVYVCFNLLGPRKKENHYLLFVLTSPFSHDSLREDFIY